MAKEKNQPDPMWADKFEADRPGEGSEEIDEDAKPIPAEEAPTEP